ncbi:uncharacterized protein LOC143316131 [Chaetodon auriga]|uniref:uncharacterized protein LOC143316131 n=1 Tax=Chaetodon auriga TaxID=39042 RepID=UPI004032ADA8
MTNWKLCFVLLLPLTVSENIRETVVKTIGSKPDVTPVCTNDTQTVITLIVCKISTERRREECRLTYHHGQDFKHECDSRFTLTVDNHTMFLHLSRLTPEDSGNYTCECSHLDGTFILSLRITVEEDDDVNISAQTPFLPFVASIGVTVVIVVSGLVLIYRGIRHRKQLELLGGRPNEEPEDIEPYSTFIQRETGLYSTARVQVANADTHSSNVLTKEDAHAGICL